MEWCNKMMNPLRKVWTNASKRIVRRRKSGLKKFRQDVRRCEYEDVHILWDMLKRKDPDLTRSRKKHCWEFVDWAKCGPLLCRGT